jgi:hypothetical protein
MATSQYWNSVHGHNGEQVMQDREGLQTLRTLAENLVWLMRSIEAGEQTVAPPFQEQRLRTDFVEKYL